MFAWFKDNRDELFSSCEKLDTNFIFLSDIDQLCFILSNKDLVNVSARACYKILKRRNNFTSPNMSFLSHYVILPLSKCT